MARTKKTKTTAPVEVVEDEVVIIDISATGKPEKIDYAEAVENYDEVLPEALRNIIFHADREAPTWRRSVSRTFDLPDSETQKKGFYHPDADFLIRQWPKDYKKFVRKGEK